MLEPVDSCLRNVRTNGSRTISQSCKDGQSLFVVLPEPQLCNLLMMTCRNNVLVVSRASEVVCRWVPSESHFRGQHLSTNGRLDYLNNFMDLCRSSTVSLQHERLSYKAPLDHVPPSTFGSKLSSDWPYRYLPLHIRQRSELSVLLVQISWIPMLPWMNIQHR